MRLLLAFALLIGPLQLSAQAPGLFGKTYLVSVGIDPYAYLLNTSSTSTSTFDTPSESQSLPTAAVRLRVEAGKVLSRNFEMSLQYTRSRVDAKGELPGFLASQPFLPLRAVRQAAVVNVRWFTRSGGGIAPAGFYARVGVGGELDRFTYTDATQRPADLDETFDLKLTPRVDLGVGYRYAPADQFMLELGFGTGFGRRGSQLIGESPVARSAQDVVNALYFMDAFRLILGLSVPF